MPKHQLVFVKSLFRSVYKHIKGPLVCFLYKEKKIMIQIWFFKWEWGINKYIKWKIMKIHMVGVGLECPNRIDPTWFNKKRDGGNN